MRTARFIAQGRLHTGTPDEDRLIDEGGHSHRQDEVVWLPPVAPTKVLGLVLNYAEHAKELGLETPKEPVLFFKPLTSLVGHHQPVIYPTGVEQLHYEVELGVPSREIISSRESARVPRVKSCSPVRGFVMN